jgi:hypothetical protein
MKDGRTKDVLTRCFAAVVMFGAVALFIMRVQSDKMLHDLEHPKEETHNHECDHR